MKKKVMRCFLAATLLLAGCSQPNEEIIESELMQEKKSLVTLQSELEQQFDPLAYSIEDPQVILDPYQASPLSALIMFSTEQVVSPKVTIVGKDEWTTFTQTFS